MADVIISRGTQSGYDSIAEKNPDQIYICLDTGNVYQGSKLLTGQIQSDWTQTDDTLKDYIKNKPDYMSASGIRIYYNGVDVTDDSSMASAVAGASSHWYGSQDSYNDLVENDGVTAGVAYHILVQPDWSEDDPSHLGYIKNQPNLLDLDVQEEEHSLRFFYTKYNQPI